MAMMFTAYFDASGNGSSSKLTIGGVVAHVKLWQSFECEWNKVLASENVAQFHATDFASSEGEYKGWKGDKDRRSSFLSRLSQVIADNTNQLFVVTVDVDSWNYVNRYYELKEKYCSPFAMAGYGAVYLTQKWAQKKRIRTPLKFIFEDGEGRDDWSGLRKLCKEGKVEPIRIPKSHAVGLQVGDLIAWKARITSQNCLRAIDNAKRKVAVNLGEIAKAREDSKSFKRILVRPTENKIYTLQSLVKIGEETCISRHS
jgi:hypothetical protein